jgi:hypothetical protein
MSHIESLYIPTYVVFSTTRDIRIPSTEITKEIQTVATLDYRQLNFKV